MPLAKFRCPLCGYETEQAAGAKDVSHSCKSRGYRQVYLDRVEPDPSALGNTAYRSIIARSISDNVPDIFCISPVYHAISSCAKETCRSAAIPLYS